MNNFPENNIPVLNTGDLVVFPGATITVSVQRPANLRAIQQAKESDGWILALANRRDDIKDSNVSELARIGVMARLIEAKATKSGKIRVLLEGKHRFKAEELSEKNGIVTASGAAIVDRVDADEKTLASLRDNLRSTVIEVFDLLPPDTRELSEEIKKISDSTELSHFVAQYMGLPRGDAQEILELTSIKNRLLKLLELAVERKEAVKVQSKIRETLSESVGKKQRDALLREQLRAIQDELGDNLQGPSADDYRKRVTDAKMPVEASTVALREVSRLERMGDQAAESHVIRNYLDLLCDMPWNTTSDAEIDLDHAREILDRDHHGLEKIKARIIEHLAVMKLRPEKRGSIILFIGPPGVGKTSLGKSIAEALGREFVRASLGGVRDDADVRGHRRTYVGALPGRIVDGIRRAKSKDPVFVLDEIDKLARGWGGDPSSALLEVLDPEQNNAFHDHYLDVPFDLSQVFFVATANSRDSIPGPLLDRMEVIDLSGYTSDEKFHIAKDHLLPSELESHGLTPAQVEISDPALRRVIEGYTREAGVRGLRRELTRICRAAAAKIARNSEQRVVVEDGDLTEILGPVRFEMEELENNTMNGVVTGMAWTPVGGDILFVEAALIPGEGRVVVTGQLGDVMKESSQIAVALSRARLEGIAPMVSFKEKDIHIHVPGGAVPKDGPSAGVTMFSAIASIMLGLPVNPKLSMTGEVTLRGRIMPVGGIKEKVLAAARAGVTEVMLPFRNAKDLDDLPSETKDLLTFHLVSDIDDVLRIVFGVSRPARILNPDVMIAKPTLLHH